MNDVLDLLEKLAKIEVEYPAGLKGARREQFIAQIKVRPRCNAAGRLVGTGTRGRQCRVTVTHPIIPEGNIKEQP